MIRRATSLAEKIHYYAFNVILMVSLVISPLYYAGVLSVSPAAAKEADAPAGASAAAIEASINNMDNLPPLSMADAVTQVNPARVAASAANSVAAQAATPTPTPPTPHYNYPSVVLEQIKQIPDNPESWAVTLTDIPELLFAEDNVAADFSNRTNQNSAWSCVVVGFGGSVQLTNGLVQASAWIGQRGMFLYLAVSDKQLGCEDTGWVGITMLPTHQLSDGNPNWYGSGYSGTVRSLRVWVQTSASNFDNSATDVFIDAIRLYGTFTPDSGDDGGSPQCGDPCHDANTKDDTQVTVGEPINPLSGNYTYSVEDITADSQGQDLSFRRIYSAQHRAWDDNNLVNLQYPLAYGWTHNYNMRLSLDSYGGYFLDGNGAAHRFNCDTGLCIEPNPTYTFAKGFLAKLTRSTNAQSHHVYDLTLFNQAHYTFEEFNSTSFNTAFIATVTSIQEAPGLPIKTFTYDLTYHYLTKVEVGNRSLRFTYTSTFPAGKAPIFLLNNVCYYGASSIQCAQYQYNPPQTGTFGDLVYSRRLTGVVDVRNQQWRYTYETHSAQTPFARLTKVEACSQTALPCNGVIMEQQDFTTFDTGQNQVLQQKNGLNNVTSSFWHMDSRTTQVMDGRGNAFTYYYDDSGSLDLVTYLDYSNAQSGILSDTQFSGPQFRPELKFDGNGNPTLMQWSANGEVLNQVTDANGKITHIEYIKDSLGHELDIVHRITDPLGHVTCYEYNSNLNYPFPTLPIAVVYDNPSVNANATDKTCPNVSGHLNQRTEFTYNESGNGTGFVSDVKNANNVITHFTYDSDGHRSAMIVNYQTGSTPPPEANLTTRYVYDALGRQILVQNPLGRCDVTLYDSAGNVTRTIQNATSSTVCKPLGTAFDTPENIAAAAATVTHDATKPTENITVDMAYDFAGRLVNVTELKNAVLLSLPIQRITHYEYNGANQMTCQIRSYTGSLTVTNACISTNLATLNASGADKNIYTLSAYDGNGNLITTTDVHGKKDWTCYDVLNRPSRVIKNAQGANPCSPSYIPSTESDKDVTTTLQYDNYGNVTQTKNPDGTLTVLQYDRLNRLIAKSDNYQNGIHQFGSEAADIDIVTLNFYDAVGNIVKTVDPARHLTMMCYDALNRKVRTVVNMGYSDTPAPFTPRTDPCVSGFTRSSASTDTDKELITDFSYDILNQLTQTVDPLGTQGRTTQYQYDAAGRVTRQITNVVVTVTDPTSQNVIRDIAYDAGGQITQITDAVGSAQQRVTCMAYDALGRQVETKRNCTTPIPVPTLDGCTTGAPSDIDVKSWVTYDSFGRLQTQKDPNCNETKFDYDALDRITKFTDPLTHAVLTAYNREGTVYSITNPPTTGAHVTLFSYDGLYRQTQTQTPLNLITKNAYDRMGRLITQTDANNNQKRFWYDGIGRMTQELEGFRFGTLPNDPNAPDTNVQTSYSYDVMSNLLQINLPNSTVITQGFDNLNQRVSLDGPLLGTVDRWGAVYDKGGRQTQVLTPTSSNQTLSYDALDRLTAINYSDSGTADTSFTYDILGRRLQMTDTNSAGSKITQYGYDRMDRVTSVNDPLSQTVGYSYDAGGRRAGITLPGSKSVGYTYDNANRLQTVNDWDAATPDVTYNYDADNQLTGMNLPNGVVVSFSYDSDNRLTQVKYQKGTQTLMQYAYTLDNVGNRTRVDETIQSVLFLGPDLVSPTLDLQTTDTTPTFTWNAVSGANGPYTYEIQVDDSVDFDSALEFTASGTATTQTPTTALPDANYHWRVRAIDNLGTKSQWSDVWTVRVDTVAPLSPNLISPYIGEQIKNFQPTFTWSDWYGIHDAVEYHIQIADNSLFTNSIIDTYVTSPTFTAPPSILTTQKTYYWRVFSKDAAGNWSTYNNWRNFNLNLQIDPVDGLATTDTTPTFKWATVTGATQYQIQVATDPNFSDIRTTWTGLPTPSGGVDSYTLPTALSSPVFTYYWRVNVNLGSGLILSQLPWQFTLEPVPTTPALTAPATASQIQYTGNTTFSWTASVWKDMPYFDYQLQIDNNSNFASPEYDHEYDRMTSVNPSASLSEGTYYWRVRAYPLYMQNEDVKSAWSTARTFVIDQTPPAATNLNLPTNYQVLNTVRPTFSWSAVSGITKYTLHYGDLCCQDNSIDRTTTSYPSTTSVQPGRYWWYVDTFDAAGNQGQSTQRIFTINILKTPVDSTTMSNQRPTFTWYAATPATGTTQYGLQVSTDPDFINLVVDTQTAALTYTIPTIQSPLAPGKYYWRVNVNLNDGNGFVPSTNRWTLGISPTTPSAPMLSSPTNGALVSALDVQLNWNASTTPGVTYEIQVDIAPDFLAAWSLGPLYDEIVNGTNWTVNLGSVETFYWRVRAIGSNGAPSPWTPIWSFTLDFIPPDAPVLSAPADNLKVTTGRPAFTWGAVTGATEYRLEVDDNPDFGSLAIGQNPTTVSFTSTTADTSLHQGVYYWRVKAKDAAGNWGSFSTVRTFTVNLLSAPVNEVSLTSRVPTFTWFKAATSGVTYRLLLSQDSMFLGVTPITGTFTTATSTVSYVVPAASQLNYGRYYWRVDTDYGLGFVPSAIVYSVNITPTQVPVAPTLVSPVTGTPVNTNKPPVTWSYNTSATNLMFYFEVQFDNNSDFSSPESDFLTPASTPAGTVQITGTPANALADGLYSWRVRAFNSYNAPSAWSLVRTLTIDTVAPVKPVLVTPTDSFTSTAVRPAFTWGAVSDATQYVLEVDDTPNFTSTLEVNQPVTAPTVTFTPTTSLKEATYYWRVKAKDAAGNFGDYSDSRILRVNVQTGPTDGTVTQNRQPQFTWVAATGFTFRLRVAADRAFTSFLVDVPLTAATVTYTPPAVLPLGRLYWRVDFVSGSTVFASPFSWALTITPPPPAPPGLMSPGNNSIVNSTTPAFTWQASKDDPTPNGTSDTAVARQSLAVRETRTAEADTPLLFSAEIAYEIQVSADADFTNVIFTHIGGDTQEQLNTPLADGQYYWRVRGINSLDVAGEWSEAYTFNVDSSVVPVPSATPTEIETLTPTDTVEPTATDTATATETPTAVPTEPATGGNSVANASDDVNESGDDFYSSNPEIWIGTGYTTEASYTGLRFSNLQIPQGATITSAHVEFYTPRDTWISLDVSMAAEAADNSPTFSPDSRPSGRSFTAQRVEHHSNDRWLAENWYSLDDISQVIQEVVDRDGWQSGSSLSVILKGIGTKWGRKYVTSFEGDPAHAPRLVVTYTEPAATTDNNSTVVQPGPLTAGQYQETQAGITYNGAWSDYAGSEASGGSVKYTNDPNATVDFQFEGVGLTLSFTQRSDSGQKVVCVDNTCQLIDLYSAETHWTQPTTIVGLPYGVHSVQIRNISAAYGDLDAVRVFGSQAEVDTAGIIKTATPTTEIVLVPTDIPTETAAFTPVPTAIPATLPFIETFDSGAGWSVSGTWLLDTQSAYSGTGWFADSSARGQVSALVYDGFIDLGSATHPQLSFWQKGQLASTDSVSVEILPEGGAGGVAVDVQTGLVSDWAQHSVDLSAYAGQTIRLRVMLTTGETLPEGEISVGYSLDELTIQDVVAEATEVPIPTAEPTSVPTATLEPTPVPTDLPTVTPTDIPTAAPEVTETPTLPPIDGQTGSFIGGGKVVAAPAMQAAAVSRTITYTYDKLYRLTSADYKENNLLAYAYDYKYDLMGNRTQAKEYVDSVGDTVTNYTYTRANQLKDSTVAGQPVRTYNYDYNGNLHQILSGSAPIATYDYDGADRLTQYTNGATGSVSSYVYNGLGDRYRQTVAGTTTDYLLDPIGGLTQVLGEFKPGSNTYYLLGLDVIGQQQGTDWSYFGYDGLGSVRQLTGSTGTVTFNANYDPYGNPLEQFGLGKSNLGFTGEYTDPSGLLYLRARYANLNTGTFLTRDPVQGFAGGGSVRWNPYIYVAGNPVNYTDPSGRILPIVAAIAFGAVVGALVGGIGNLASQLAHNGGNIRCIDKSAFLNATLEAGIQGAIGGVFGGPLEQAATTMIWEMAVHHTPVDQAFVKGMAALAFASAFEVGMGLAGEGLSMLRGSGGVADDVARGLEEGVDTIDDDIVNSLDEADNGLGNGSCPINSFSADTLVATEDGETPIGDLKVGDKVLAYNAATGQTGEYPITAVISHTDEVITDLTIDGESIETTPQHPFYTQERGWVDAGDLQVGEHIRTADWDYGTVESVRNVQQTQPMYNLTVDEAHTFFVGDGQWLVHNSVACPDPLEVNGWKNRDSGPISPQQTEAGIYEFKRGQGLKVGSTAKALRQRLREQWKEFGRDMNNVVYTFLDTSPLETGLSLRQAFDKRETITAIAERIRREQLIEKGFTVFGDISASPEAVKAFWNGAERKLIPNWPDWLEPPAWMLK